MKTLWFLILTGFMATGCTAGHLERIAQQFAPLVLFDSGESYFPCSIDWYIAHADLMRPDGTLEKQVGTYNGATLSKRYHSSKYAHYYIEPLLSSYAGAPLKNNEVIAPCYAIPTIKSGTDGRPYRYSIEYWFSYTFNGKQEFAQWLPVEWFPHLVHQADWEHIIVQVIEEPGKPPRIEKADYHTHNFGTTYQADQLTFAFGSHPVVYAARGGHASYPYPIYLINDEGDRANGEGVSWKTWNHLSLVQFPNPSQDWMFFAGRYGKKGIRGINARRGVQQGYKTVPLTKIRIDVKKTGPASDYFLIDELPEDTCNLHWTVSKCPNRNNITFKVMAEDAGWFGSSKELCKINGALITTETDPIESSHRLYISDVTGLADNDPIMVTVDAVTTYKRSKGTPPQPSELFAQGFGPKTLLRPLHYN